MAKTPSLNASILAVSRLAIRQSALRGVSFIVSGYAGPIITHLGRISS
jgi:hypothetical protein